jgi:hypothetical protein
MTENERFELVFVKTGSINYGTGLLTAYNFDSKGEKSKKKIVFCLLMGEPIFALDSFNK